MKKFLCCFKGESSRQGAQEQTVPAQPPEEPTDPWEIIAGINNTPRPFGENELLTYCWRNNFKLLDDPCPRDNTANRHQFTAHQLNSFGVTFRWQEIVDGTLNFRRSNYLGEGSFGEVYHCDIPGINKAGAAKIEDLGNAQAHLEFMAEITTLHAANHPNVITLVGKCFGFERSALVYEFMPKGSLDHHLYAHKKPGMGLPQRPLVLNWETRMKIAVGVAKALVYLHEQLKVLHRDVKVSNVLLDEDFEPKLADFGLATKIVEDKDGVEQQSKIRPIKGTKGCMAPETEVFALVSTKSDVYGYGVFLFTLFTGRKAYDVERPLETFKITDWLSPIWSRQEDMPTVLDAALGNRFSVEGLNRLFQAARMCVNSRVLERPSMGLVEEMVREAAAHEVTELPLVRERSSI